MHSNAPASQPTSTIGPANAESASGMVMKGPTPIMFSTFADRPPQNPIARGGAGDALSSEAATDADNISLSAAFVPAWCCCPNKFMPYPPDGLHNAPVQHVSGADPESGCGYRRQSTTRQDSTGIAVARYANSALEDDRSPTRSPWSTRAYRCKRPLV